MILTILFITAYVAIADDSMLCDERYCLHTVEPVEPLQVINSFEDAMALCNKSSAWLLEIYDESVWKLLQNLQTKIQNVDWSKGTLLGMKQSNIGWQWINNKLYDESINTISYKDIEKQNDLNKVVRAVLNPGKGIQYIATDMYSTSNFVICNKKKTSSSCPGWEDNGLCFYAISRSTTWYQAHNLCVQNQSSMATFGNTSWNIEYCKNLTGGFWVGLSKDTWKWLHSDAFVTYNKWTHNIDMSKKYTYVDKEGNWISEDWQIASRAVVCMSDSKKSTMKSTVQDIDKNSSSSSSNTSDIIVDHPYELSIGAKAGIGIGVSLGMIIIIIIVGVLVFKYCKRKFGRKSSRNPLEQESHYAEIVPGNNYIVSNDNNPKEINYADLYLQSRDTLANDNELQ